MMGNRYDKYKDSGIAWIGEIPEHWNIVQLKRCSEFINGYAFNSNYFNKNTGIPVIRIGDICNEKISFENIVYVQEDKDLDKFIVQKNDILIAMSGATVGKIGIYEDENIAYINQRVGIIRAHQYDFIKRMFFTKGFTDYISLSSAGSAQPNISSDEILNFYIPFPLKKEQQTIAAYLDQKCGEIDELITLQEEMITKLQSYKQSVITEAVTKGLDKNAPLKDSGIEWIGKIPEHWVVKRLKYVCDFNPQNDQSISKLSEVGYLPMERLKNGYMLPSVISVSNLTQGLTFFKENDIVLAKVTPCFENGNIAIAKNLVNNCGFGSSELFVFRVKSINRKYLFYLLQEGKIKDVCKSTMIGTGGLKRISPIFMKNIQLPIPSLSEQQSIADYLDQRCSEIDELISIKQQKIEKLKEYKKSLIFECVTGKRKVS